MNKKIISFLSILLITLSLFGAKANPSRYAVTLTQGDWLAGNTLKINQGQNFTGYLGRLDINVDWATTIANPITMVITTPFDDMRLTHVDNSNYSLPAAINFNLGGNNVSPSVLKSYSVNTSPFILKIPFASSGSATAGCSFDLFVPSFSGSPSIYAGTYVASYRFRFFVDYGTVDEIELTAYERVYSVICYYVNPSSNPSGSSYFTNLIIDKYANAENIDVNYMRQNNISMLVGAVTFGSNDSRNNAKYKIKVSPGENVNGDFSFHKTGATPIPYKVHIFNRTQPATKAFTFNVPGKGTSGYYQDYFELGISNVNHLDVSLKAGEYSSQIRIDLIVD